MDDRIKEVDSAGWKWAFGWNGNNPPLVVEGLKVSGWEKTIYDNSTLMQNERYPVVNDVFVIADSYGISVVSVQDPENENETIGLMFKEIKDRDKCLAMLDRILELCDHGCLSSDTLFGLEFDAGAI